MRPLFYGIIFFVIGAVAFVFSIVINVVTLGHFRTLSNVLGIATAASMPVAILAELIRWLMKRKSKK